MTKLEKQLLEALKQINGAPLGSERYFTIHEIACNAEKLAEKPAKPSPAQRELKGAFTRAYNASRKLYKKHDTAARNQKLFDAGFYAPWHKVPKHA